MNIKDSLEDQQTPFTSRSASSMKPLVQCFISFLYCFPRNNLIEKIGKSS